MASMVHHDKRIILGCRWVGPTILKETERTIRATSIQLFFEQQKEYPTFYRINAELPKERENRSHYLPLTMQTIGEQVSVDSIRILAQKIHDLSITIHFKNEKDVLSIVPDPLSQPLIPGGFYYLEIRSEDEGSIEAVLIKEEKTEASPFSITGQDIHSISSQLYDCLQKYFLPLMREKIQECGAILMYERRSSLPLELRSDIDGEALCGTLIFSALQKMSVHGVRELEEKVERSSMLEERKSREEILRSFFMNIGEKALNTMLEVAITEYIQGEIASDVFSTIKTISSNFASFCNASLAYNKLIF